MATTLNSLWCAGTVNNKLGGKDALSVTITLTGNSGAVAVEDVVIVHRQDITDILDSDFGGSEVVAFLITNYIAKIT